MRSVQYFTRDGRPLSEREAHDRHGVIRDGVIVRIPMQFCDSADDPRLRFTSDCRVTDGQGGVAGLHRPGFRIAADDACNIVRRDLCGRLEGTFEEEEEEDTERQTSDAAMRP